MLRGRPRSVPGCEGAAVPRPPTFGRDKATQRGPYPTAPASAALLCCTGNRGDAETAGVPLDTPPGNQQHMVPGLGELKGSH